MRKPKPPLWLTPAVFHILLALFGKERHGYGIMQLDKADSQGAAKMGPGTLYGSLNRMIEAGLVTKVNTKTRAAFSTGTRPWPNHVARGKRSGRRASPSLRAASWGKREL